MRRLDQPQVSGGLGEQALRSYSTKLANDASQVAGYVRVPQWGAGCAPRQIELRSPACLRLIEGTPKER